MGVTALFFCSDALEKYPNALRFLSLMHCPLSTPTWEQKINKILPLKSSSFRRQNDSAYTPMGHANARVIAFNNTCIHCSWNWKLDLRMKGFRTRNNIIVFKEIHSQLRFYPQLISEMRLNFKHSTNRQRYEASLRKREKCNTQHWKTCV